MLKSLLRLTTLSFITISFVAHSEVVVDSTRHFYKEVREKSAQTLKTKMIRLISLSPG